MAFLFPSPRWGEGTRSFHTANAPPPGFVRRRAAVPFAALPEQPEHPKAPGRLRDAPDEAWRRLRRRTRARRSRFSLRGRSGASGRSVPAAGSMPRGEVIWNIILLFGRRQELPRALPPLVVMPGFVPGLRALRRQVVAKSWMAGTSLAVTRFAFAAVFCRCRAAPFHSITISPVMPCSAWVLPSRSRMPHCRSVTRPVATGTNHHSAAWPG
jgi:hypothetical protein